MSNLVFGKLSIFYILILCASFKVTISKGPDVFCPLLWLPSGLGHVPKNAVECSPGIQEFVGRAYNEADNIWMPGRIITYSGIGYFTHNGVVIEADTYQVLVIQENCDTEWVEKDNAYLNFRIPVDIGARKNFVGRTISTSRQSICGGVDDANTGLSIAIDNLKFQTNKRFEVLTSIYPKLNAVVYNFEFQRGHLENSLTTKELIGQEKFTVGPSLSGTSAAKTIEYRKLTLETFVFTENVHSWAGIDNVSLTFPLFYGTSDFRGIQKVDEVDLLVFDRERELVVSAIFNAIQPQGNNIPYLNIEACAFASVVKNSDFEFTASIRFKSERLKDSDIIIILTELGRPPSVIETIEGVMTSSFVLNTEIIFDEPDPSMICGKHF